MRRLIERISTIANWQVAASIVLIGSACFFTGLTNPFMGDDNPQIVNNPVVHTISHVPLLFQGGTGYNGHGIAPLGGTYYRPIMMTVFAALYSLFGPHTVYFHVFQLLIFMAGVFVLYLLFKSFLGNLLAFILAIVFLVHPLNSQAVFAIPAMQDVLMLLFGVSALWLLRRFSSPKILFAVVPLLFVTVLCKEVGALFILMALLQLVLFDRRRFLILAAAMVLPVAAYVALRYHAVGLSGHSTAAPIDSVGLTGRLLTLPSIVLFYATKFVLPWHLASGYYWVHPTFGFRTVLLPLLVDVIIVGALVYAGRLVRKQADQDRFKTYVFFAVWMASGLVAYSQVLPLDMTACEDWFLFSMIGLLGMIGVLLVTFQTRIKPEYFAIIIILVVALLGVRTAIRGTEWRSEYILASHDIVASKENYNAYNSIATHYMKQQDYKAAKPYLEQSIRLRPAASNYGNLGIVLMNLGDYAGAEDAFNRSIRLDGYVQVYENLGKLALLYGDPATNQQFVTSALQKFPQNSTLWLSLAILQEKTGNNAAARAAVAKAASYGQTPQFIYDNIMAKRPFTVILAGKYVNVP